MIEGTAASNTSPALCQGGAQAAIYCRLSEEDRDKSDPEADSRSIQNQKSMLVNYAMEKGWEIYNIYSDDDYTGSDRDRPQFNQLLRDAKAGKFSIVLCKSQSRFTREMELVERYIHGLFVEWGIRFVGYADNADTANKGNKKARQINGLVNEWYLEDMSENIRTVLDNKRKQGEFIGSFCAYGYQKDPRDKHHLIVDEAAAEQVRRIFALYLEGYGVCAIAKMFNDKKIPNPSAYKKIHNPSFNRGRATLTGDQWTYSTVIHILKNKIYIGTTVQHKNEKISYKSKQERPVPEQERIAVEGTHEPIVSQEVWQAVQAALCERGKAQHTQGKRDLLGTKCRCAVCGGKMTPSYRTLKNGEKVKRFRCRTHLINPALCPGTSIKKTDVEQIVLRAVQQAVTELADKNYLEQNLQLEDRGAENLKALRRQLAELQKKLDQQQGYFKELYKDKVRGLLSEDQFLELSEDFQKEKADLDRAQRDLLARTAAAEQAAAQRQSAAEIVERYLHVQELSDEMVAQLIDKICIGPSEKWGAAPPVELRWNF